MSRIYSAPGEKGSPTINTKSVAEFFDSRAEKITTLGPIQAVIYQDKHPALAAKRNIAEKTKLLPFLQLDGTQRVLDVGCGTGRWAENLLPMSSWYHGLDACEGLITHARKQFANVTHGRFTVASADDYSLETLNEYQCFDRVLCAGVLIYLNEDAALRALRCMANVLAPKGLVLLREPVGIYRRLTISEHYSDDMEQDYSAIYRTRDELDALILKAMPKNSFRLVASGDVYEEESLNNRSDTKQQWLLLERA